VVGGITYTRSLKGHDDREKRKNTPLNSDKKSVSTLVKKKIGLGFGSPVVVFFENRLTEIPVKKLLGEVRGPRGGWDHSGGFKFF